MNCLAEKKPGRFRVFACLTFNQNKQLNTNNGSHYPFTIGSNIETVTCAIAADGRINHHDNPVLYAANA